jgi:ATPase family protein associated with various cellular activities (AAA)/winged helix domain-containing protein
MDHHDPTLSPVEAIRPPWLAPWFAWLDLALHRELLRLRTRYSLSLDELRGIYISDAYVEALLAARPGEPANPESERIAGRSRALFSDLRASSSPLTDIAEDFGLSFAEACTLVICVAPEVELRYQSVFAYLADDVRKRLPTIDLCIRLIGSDIDGTALLDSHAPIFTAGLVEVVRSSGESAWRAAGLSLADPIRTHLLGVGRTDSVVERVAPRVLFVESGDSDSYAATFAGQKGRTIVEVDERHGSPGRALSDLLIRARLEGQVVHAAAPGEAGAVEAILAAPVHLVLGPQWQPHLAGIEFETVRGPRTTPATKAKARHALATLAQCVPRTFTWDDLVLPSPTTTRLHELASALVARDTVFDEWGFRRLGGGHSSLRILFTGASGTGKTMSAAVIAREVGLELFQVDVSAVMSKYIGETEKNLEAIFRAAEGSDVLLFFDEADALFGKRSEVADAHDRYANIEASYLLQRVERYDGALILATNLPANMDEAFSRRLHGEIEFPLPDERARQRLWSKAFPAAAPVADDVDPVLLAKQFQLTGGDIRNVALAAAFLAAHERVPIALAHVMRALARQRHRQGKLPTLAEFGQYLHLVRAE